MDDDSFLRMIVSLPWSVSATMAQIEFSNFFFVQVLGSRSLVAANATAAKVLPFINTNGSTKWMRLQNMIASSTVVLTVWLGQWRRNLPKGSRTLCRSLKESSSVRAGRMSMSYEPRIRSWKEDEGRKWLRLRLTMWVEQGRKAAKGAVCPCSVSTAAQFVATTAQAAGMLV